MSVSQKLRMFFLISVVLFLSFNSNFNSNNIVDATITATLTPSTTNWTPNPITIQANASTNSPNVITRIYKPDGTYVNSSSTLYTVYSNGTYNFQFRNSAGEIVSESITITNIDRNVPFVWSEKLEPGVKTNQNVTIYIDAGDADSGIKQITHPNGTVVFSPNTSYSVSSNGNYRFIIEDKTGRELEHNVTVSNIDKTVATVNLLTLMQNENNYYDVYLNTTDSSGIDSVWLNTGENLTMDLEDSTRYYIKNLSMKPTYIKIRDGVNNDTSNISFLDVPTISGYSGLPTNQDVNLQLNGTGTLSYKKEYKNYACSSKPCNVVVQDNVNITAINKSTNKVSMKEIKIDNIDKRNINFALKGSRNTNNENQINLQWNKYLSTGILSCETPEGRKTFSVTGTTYTLSGRNYEYTCEVEGTSSGNTVSSNRLTFPPNYDKTVVFTEPSDSMPTRTFIPSIKVFVETDKIGEFYMINGVSKNSSSNIVPIPTDIAQ